MSDFYRSYSSWRSHPKRVKLVRRLGLAGDIAVRELWAWCADSDHGHTDGELGGMTAEDIAIAADNYAGDADQLVATLVELRLIDGEPGAYRVHDWLEWQPWAAGHSRRKAAGRANALVKSHKDGHHAYRYVDDCPACQSQPNGCKPQSDSQDSSANGSAPIRSDPLLSDPDRSDHVAAPSQVPEAGSVGSSSAAPPGQARTVDELGVALGAKLGKKLRERLEESKALPLPAAWVPEALVIGRGAHAEGRTKDVIAFAVGVLVNWRTVDARPWPGSEQERARTAEAEKATGPPAKRRRKKPKRIEPPREEDPPCSPEEAQRIRELAKKSLGIDSG